VHHRNSQDGARFGHTMRFPRGSVISSRCIPTCNAAGGIRARMGTEHNWWGILGEGWGGCWTCSLAQPMGALKVLGEERCMHALGVLRGVPGA